MQHNKVAWRFDLAATFIIDEAGATFSLLLRKILGSFENVAPNTAVECREI